MAWEWSHTEEAYEAVRTQIGQQPREWLEVVWAEWVTAKRVSSDMYSHAEFDNRTYATCLARAKGKTDDVLARCVWWWAEAYRTCTNGGHMAHCCPYGCMGHMLPFSPEEEVA